VLRLVADDTGVYRAGSNPSADDALALLERKVLAPRLGPGVASPFAPTVAISEGIVGSEADLETRIDVPPLAHTGGAFDAGALRKLFAGRKLEAALQLQSTRRLPGEVFVDVPSAVVLTASTDWDGEASRSALLASIESLWTTSRLGADWVERGQGGATYFELNGLAHLAAASHGHFLVAANASQPLLAVLSRISNPPSDQGGVYAAGFRQARERENVVEMLSLIETPFAMRLATGQRPGGREPLFFSENLASLSRALGRVESTSILVHDRGPRVVQTIRYRLSP
jgi:hypothetical protein